MAHWLDRLALRAATGAAERGAVLPGPRATPTGKGLLRHDLVGLAAAETAAHLPLELSSPILSIDGPFSRRAGLRALGLAAGLLVAAPLQRLGPSSAAAASSADCLPGCLTAAEERYRRRSIGCNSGLPEPRDFLFTPLLMTGPLCQAIAYQELVDGRRRCVQTEDCGRKQPPPPAPPMPKRGPAPPPPGGCGFVGLTSCGATCCPAGSLCGAAGCIPPPPAADCNPPCPPGKKCQGGQCVEAPISCRGLCPDNAKCCPSCGSGNFCWPAEVPCRC